MLKFTIKHKNVEFTELFYDLVFVYAISRTTALIHHLHNGIVSGEAFSTFIVTTFVLIDAWMMQTVFTNQYGKNSFLNISTMFIKMVVLLVFTGMIVNDWHDHFNYLCWTIAALSFMLFVQYFAQYYSYESTKEERHSIRGFLAVTGLRVFGMLAAGLFPIYPGFYIYLVTIIVTFLMPIYYRNRQEQVDNNFVHLVERISLLTIINLGEMIMGIAPFFTLKTFTLSSVLYFTIVACLFMYYFSVLNHSIDEHADMNGMFLMYSHYPIYIGLIMITVSMSFISRNDANVHFVTLFMYAGIFMFQWAVIANNMYSKPHLSFDAKYYAVQLWIFLFGSVASYNLAHNDAAVLHITTAAIVAITVHSIGFFYMRNLKERRRLKKL